MAYHGLLAYATNPERKRKSWQLLLVLSLLVLLAACAGRQTKAPISDRSSGAVSAGSAAAGGSYTVRAGDTIFKIAREHGMEPGTLMQINGISDPTQLAVGKVLSLGGAVPSDQSGAAVASPVALPGASTAAAGAAPAPAPAASVARAADANSVAWAWPVSGKIIQGFSSTFKGVDIEGAPGTSIAAAADGDVLYVGNGVRGLGNLVLIGHGSTFITAYGHNDQILVKKGDKVKKGAKIATMGQSDTSSPRLHFEIRRQNVPVNPLAYLPPR